MTYSLSLVKPTDFNCALHVALCYCYVGNRLLFLKRHPAKPQGEKWCLPGGKLELQETSTIAVMREIKEEIGLTINHHSTLKQLGLMYFKLPHIDYICYLFQTQFDTIPSLHLALDEHTEFKWVTVEEAYELPLVTGGHELIDHFLQFNAELCHNTGRQPVNPCS